MTIARLFNACAEGDLSTLHDLISEMGPASVNMRFLQQARLSPKMTNGSCAF